MQFTKSDLNAVKEQVRPEAEKNVLYRLIAEIMNKEGIEVSSEEVDKEIEDMAKKYNTTADDLIKQVGSKDMFQYDLEIQKHLIY